MLISVTIRLASKIDSCFIKLILSRVFDTCYTLHHAISTMQYHNFSWQNKHYTWNIIFLKWRVIEYTLSKNRKNLKKKSFSFSFKGIF